jgi:hypothetical protein
MYRPSVFVLPFHRTDLLGSQIIPGIVVLYVDRTGQDCTWRGQDRTVRGQDKTRLTWTGQDRTVRGQDRTATGLLSCHFIAATLL